MKCRNVSRFIRRFASMIMNEACFDFRCSSVVTVERRFRKQRKEVEILGNQFLRSGTSVTAHAREASRARSDAAFYSKLDGLLTKKQMNPQLWLELLRDDARSTTANNPHCIRRNRQSFSRSLQPWWRKSARLIDSVFFSFSACQLF